MAQESRQWYQNDNYETDSALGETPTGRFNADDIEFESFMFDGGQGVGIDLSRSGPLAGVAAVEVSPVKDEADAGNDAIQTPFMGTEVPRVTSTGPLRPLQPQTGPLQHVAQDATSSGPISMAQMQAEPSPFAGSATPPQSGPLRQSGPLVDGRTSSGPLSQSGPLRQTGPFAQSGPLPQTGPLTRLRSLAQAGTSQAAPPVQTGPLTQRNTGPLTWAGVMAPGGTGPLTQRNSGPLSSLSQPNTGPLSPDMAEPPQTGPVTQNGNGTGPLQSHSYTSSGPLTQPSRFTQSGPLTPADIPDASPSGPLHSPIEESVATPDPMPRHQGWSDSSLAATEDFSAVLFTMNSAMQFTTSGSLSSGSLADAAIAQGVAPNYPSEAQYSNAVPVIRDTGPHYVSPEPDAYAPSEAAVSLPSYAPDALPVDPVSWGEESLAQEWEAAPSAEMPVVEAPAPESLMPTPPAEMQAPAQTGEAQTQFSGEAMEFEPFMFNGGSSEGMPELPHMEQFMPAVTGMEAALAPDQPVPSMYSEAPSAADEATQAIDKDALPFWLQNTGDLTSAQMGNYLPMMGDMGMQQEAPTLALGSIEASPVSEEAQPADSDDLNLYADLPPIDPFDFTALDVPAQEETLGFNTAELSGYASSSYDPMVATADLQVVASILGTDPDLDMMNSEPLHSGMAGGEAGIVAEDAAPATLTLPDEQTDAISATQTPAVDAQPRSWTATVTSNLSMETLPGGQSGSDSMAEDTLDAEVEGLDIAPFDFSKIETEPEEKATGLLTMPRVKNTGPLNAIAAADMPYSAPDDGRRTMDDKEQPETQAAPPQQQRQPQSNGRRWATGWLGDSGTEVMKAAPDIAPVKDTQDDMPEQEAPTAYESLEAQPEAALTLNEPVESQPEEVMAGTFYPEQEVALDDGPTLTHERDESLRTGSLVLPDDEDDEEVESASMGGVSQEEYSLPADAEAMQDGVADQYEAQPADYVDYSAEEPQDEPSVHVASEWTEPEPEPEPEPAQTMSPATPEEPGQTSASEPQQATVVTSYPNTYQPVQSYAEAQAEEYNQQIKFPTSVLASGPLPSLDGFEELMALVASNPNDVGAHMALASGYAQVGDVDTQLRVYRRVLKKPGVSNKILRLIAEELSDYEADLTGHPHFHQARGDLYMKQNRFQDAIEEYNKIG